MHEPLTRSLRTAWLIAALSFVPAGASPCAAAAGTTLREVIFTDYTEYSSYAELARRLLSPLTVLRLGGDAAGTAAGRAGQPVDLAVERFLVHVPPQQPSRGFALLVFVPPWQDARLPAGWESALDRSGTIFVSAAHSGNDESVMGRREPLALLAAHNLMRRYPVDPERVYVAGFSGGSHVALRLALGYPDVFRGAILDAGSDPIGDAQIPLPSKELFLKFQSSTHLVYLTGEEDTAHLSEEMLSVRSMHQWCVFNADSYVQPRIGHEVGDATALARALGSLVKDFPSESPKLAACRSAIERELAAKLEEVEGMRAGGRPADARRLLEKIDAHFGGLAAPRSVELAMAASAPRSQP